MDKKFGTNWEKPLLENAKTEAQFKKNFFQKLDALRGLQFLKESYVQDARVDLKNIEDLLLRLGRESLTKEAHELLELATRVKTLNSLEEIDIPLWIRLRKILFREERQRQALQKYTWAYE